MEVQIEIIVACWLAASVVLGSIALGLFIWITRLDDVDHED